MKYAEAVPLTFWQRWFYGLDPVPTIAHPVLVSAQAAHHPSFPKELAKQYDRRTGCYWVGVDTPEARKELLSRWAAARDLYPVGN